MVEKHVPASLTEIGLLVSVSHIGTARVITNSTGAAAAVSLPTPISGNQRLPSPLGDLVALLGEHEDARKPRDLDRSSNWHTHSNVAPPLRGGKYGRGPEISRQAGNKHPLPLKKRMSRNP